MRVGDGMKERGEGRPVNVAGLVLLVLDGVGERIVAGVWRGWSNQVLLLR